MMKATGIVRRIDELGRVVIPKEIRRTMRIHEGDPLEIFTDGGGGVILKKYYPLGEFSGNAEGYAEAINRILGHTVVICDKEQVLFAQGALKKELVGKSLNSTLSEMLTERQILNLYKGEQKMLPVIKDDEISYTAQLIVPILSAGEMVGAVLLLSKEPSARFSEVEEKVCKTVADCIGQQIEL